MDLNFRKRIVIDVPVYDYKLNIFIGDVNDVPESLRPNIKEYTPKYKIETGRYESKGRSSRTIHYDESNNEFTHVIFVDGYLPKDEIYEILSHEVQHQITNLTLDRNLIAKGFTEPIAYLASYFAKCLKDTVRELLTE